MVQQGMMCRRLLLLLLPLLLLLLPILKTVVPTFVHPWRTACCSSAHVNARLHDNVSRTFCHGGKTMGASSAVGVNKVR